MDPYDFDNEPNVLKTEGELFFSYIKKKGKQTKMINEIKTGVSQGNSPSHVLNIKLANQGTNFLGGKIREFIFDKLNLVQNHETVQQVGEQPHDAWITWRASTTKTSQYYQTKVTMLSDLAVVLATRKILLKILLQLQNVGHFAKSRGPSQGKKEFIDWKKFGLTYIVFKPCSVNQSIQLGSGTLTAKDINNM